MIGKKINNNLCNLQKMQKKISLCGKFLPDKIKE